MTYQLKTIIGATCLTLMLAPAMPMAAENAAESQAANPCDNGQYADEANPCADNAMGYNEEGSGDEAAFQDEGSGDEAAYQDEGQAMDESENDAEVPRKESAAQ